jgi:hypothetical protein
MLEGAAQILERTNCLAIGGAWLLPAFPAQIPTVTVSSTSPSPIAGVQSLG